MQPHGIKKTYITVLRLSLFFFFFFIMYLLSKVFILKHNFSKQVSISSTAFLFKQTMSTTASDSKPAILNWASKDGEFKRQQSTFRDFIEDDVNAKFAAEP